MPTETQCRLEAAWELSVDIGGPRKFISGCPKLQKRNWAAIRYKARGKTYAWTGTHIKPPTSKERVRQMVAKFIENVKYYVENGMTFDEKISPSS